MEQVIYAEKNKTIMLTLHHFYAIHNIIRMNVKVAQNSFQHLDFDGSLQAPLITWCLNRGI